MRLLHIILLFFVFVLAYGTEVDVSNDGFSSSNLNEGTSSTDRRRVTVVNSYDKEVSIYWESSDDNDDKEYFMFNIEANGTMVMNTYNGHSFYSKEFGALERLPDVIDVVEAFATYTIGQNELPTADKKSKTNEGYELPSTINPVTIMGIRSTAMSAKFRCLCKAVDYYYDDGKDGTYQGSLTLGIETTTNSYEGHVFFFTEKGNKKKEIARYTMKQDQVKWTRILK